MSSYAPSLSHLVPHLIPKATKSAFLQSNIHQGELYSIGTSGRETWTVEKLCLLHRNCPDELTEYFLDSPEWYKRLTAALAKGKRAKYCTRLFKDPKSTVRASAYKTAMALEALDVEVARIASLVLEDARVHGYFPEKSDTGFFYTLENMRLLVAGKTAREVEAKCVAEYDAYQLQRDSAREEAVRQSKERSINVL